jgi:hypothetical protein
MLQTATAAAEQRAADAHLTVKRHRAVRGDVDAVATRVAMIQQRQMGRRGERQRKAALAAAGHAVADDDDDIDDEDKGVSGAGGGGSNDLEADLTALRSMTERVEDRLFAEKTNVAEAARDADAEANKLSSQLTSLLTRFDGWARRGSNGGGGGDGGAAQRRAFVINGRNVSGGGGGGSGGGGTKPRRSGKAKKSAKAKTSSRRSSLSSSSSSSMSSSSSSSPSLLSSLLSSSLSSSSSSSSSSPLVAARAAWSHDSDVHSNGGSFSSGNDGHDGGFIDGGYDGGGGGIGGGSGGVPCYDDFFNGVNVNGDGVDINNYNNGVSVNDDGGGGFEGNFVDNGGMDVDASELQAWRRMNHSMWADNADAPHMVSSRYGSVGGVTAHERRVAVDTEDAAFVAEQKRLQAVVDAIDAEAARDNGSGGSGGGGVGGGGGGSGGNGNGHVGGWDERDHRQFLRLRKAHGLNRTRTRTRTRVGADVNNDSNDGGDDNYGDGYAPIDAATVAATERFVAAAAVEIPDQYPQSIRRHCEWLARHTQRQARRKAAVAAYASLREQKAALARARSAADEARAHGGDGGDGGDYTHAVDAATRLNDERRTAQKKRLVAAEKQATDSAIRLWRAQKSQEKAAAERKKQLAAEEKKLKAKVVAADARAHVAAVARAREREVRSNIYSCCTSNRYPSV